MTIVHLPPPKARCIMVLTLSYTTDDDGVWTECDRCGFRKNLGFFATVEDANTAQDEHDNLREDEL